MMGEKADKGGYKVQPGSKSDTCGILDVLKLQAVFCDRRPGGKSWSPGRGLQPDETGDYSLELFVR